MAGRDKGSLDTPYYAPYATSYYNQWIGLYKIEFIWLREYSCIDFVFARLVGILFTTVALRLVVCLRRKLPATYDAQFYCFLVRVLEQGWILNISTPRPFLIEVSASTSLIVPTCVVKSYTDVLEQLKVDLGGFSQVFYSLSAYGS
ncbi:hypothetical protein C5167_018278 [Papaver somniferum]|uniref:Uncharacterized protein n=1 Tax=Papaver somniferum TaxID=3469 RepID=A0A4Y7IP18_PAPSO|nr:hypothetical protein C5167_018278 [Papaver somniferum]